MKNEKRIMDISFIGSILFMLAEGIMAYVTHSHSLLMDCIFDVTDLIMIGPFLVLVPLLYKPVTEKRPYGFSQVESLFIVIKYSVLLVITVQLIWDNIMILFHGGRQVDAGMIAVFELGVWAGCVFIYLLLRHFSRRYESLTIKAEIYIWKLDIISSLGVSIAFFIQMGLQKTEWAHLAAYIDPFVAIVMACLLLVEPVKMIIINLKNLVLFAPDERIMQEIRQIAEKYMDRVYYDIEFLDVIQTGRKTWVEIYLTSHNDMMNTRILHQLRNEIRTELREKFDQVYVELIPDLPED
ncbi:MAG: cation diffusion facilitator family transporter [Clostridiales bacterium]|nr:cation diffusion facilitator family transporter [Clostridiales bacterium]